jgi:hypothetical protein
MSRETLRFSGKQNSLFPSRAYIKCILFSHSDITAGSPPFRVMHDSANKTNLSLIGMQLPEKYNEKFDVSSKALHREAFARNVKILLVFFR